MFCGDCFDIFLKDADKNLPENKQKTVRKPNDSKNSKND